jgi:glycosyltransferase involved in cell wall biosynthesis
MSSICLLSLSRIADDPRVRRQGDAFARAGWRVVGVGAPGATSDAPAWPIYVDRIDVIKDGGATGTIDPVAATHTPSFPPSSAWRTAPILRYPLVRKLLRPGHRAIRLAQKILVWWRRETAFDIYWSWTAVRELYETASAFSPDIWLANDWTALPVAARLARERGGRYGYDTHELAVEEYAERWKWRVLERPIVRAVEKGTIAGAAVVSAVSMGIAAHLQKLYGLPIEPLVIRNTPSYIGVLPRQTGARIRILYHGIVAEGRGIEATIDSVPLWRSEFDLTIRGPGDPTYINKLRGRIDNLRIAGRVAVAPPVPMLDLVRAASAFDVGFFALPSHSHHNTFALPNKFFEYAMAGLALCVSDLPEMGDLIRQHNMGVTLPTLSPEGIAEVINRLDRSAVDRYRANALAAARVLCWERESERLVQAYAGALDSTKGNELRQIAR